MRLLSLFIFCISTYSFAQQSIDATLKKAKDYYAKQKIDSSYIWYRQAYDMNKDSIPLQDIFDFAWISYSLSLRNQAEIVCVYGIKRAEQDKDSKRELWLHMTLSKVLMETENYEEAEAEFEFSEQLAAELGLEEDVIRIKRYRVQSYIAQGQYDLAEKTIGEVLEFYEAKKSDYGYPSSYYKSLYALASIKYFLKEYDSAVQLYSQISDFTRENNDRESLIESLLGLAWSYEKKGDYDKAKELANEAIFYSEEIGDLSLQVNAFQALAEINAHLGNNHKELEHYISLRDSLEGVNAKRIKDFAHIEYQTEKRLRQIDELNLENAQKEAQVQRFKALMIALGGIALIAFLVLILNYYLRRLKKEKAALEENVKILNVRLEEQNIISKKLHDEIVGDLRSLQWKLQKDDLDDNHLGLLERSMEKIRDISHELSSENFEEVDFEGQMKGLIIDVLDKGFRLDVQNLNKVPWASIDTRFKKAIYFSLREAVHNAIKYSQVDHMIVGFEYKDGLIGIDVIDEGAGYDPENTKGGIGIRSARQRVHDLGGSFDLKAAVDKGVSIHIELNAKEYEKV